ncbi:MAG: hypothetical protein WCZ23_02215 [Rhodospirillaceae bacterium]
MSQVAIFLALPFGLALAAAAALRLAGGDGAGARLSGAAVPAGFLAAWTWLHGLTLVPSGLVEVAAPVALGGALAGLALDATAARPGWRMIVGAVFVAAGVWAATGLVGAVSQPPADAPAKAALWVGIIALTAAWTGTLLRLRRYSASNGAEGAALLAALAAGLGLTAAALGAMPIAAPAAGLAASALGFMVLAGPLGLPLAGGAVLGGGGALLGLTQALAVDWPGSIIPLIVLALGLFAGGTAQRLPGAARWRPAWMLALALLPGLLAAATALALRG